MHALAFLEGWRLTVREVTCLAVFHMHAHRIIGFAAQVFLDRVTTHTAAECAEQRHRGTAAPASKLISDKTARYRTTYRTNTGSVALVFHRRDSFHRAACPAIRGSRRLLFLNRLERLLHRLALRRLRWSLLLLSLLLRLLLLSLQLGLLLGRQLRLLGLLSFN